MKQPNSITRETSAEADRSSGASQSSYKTSVDALIDRLNGMIALMGYEIVHLEIQSHRQNILRLFIDFVECGKDGERKIIGIEDCVAVTRALDEPLDQMPEVDALLHGAYELEVSSPGVDRPLRQAKDFVRFAGREARIHTFRPLTVDEMGNASYFAKNPKQKNFFGTVSGFKDDKVQLVVSSGPSAEKGKSKKKSKTNKEADAGAGAEISIPLPLISKANLEPKFEFGPDTSKEDESQ